MHVRNGLLAAMALLVAAAPLSALTFDSHGNVTDWGITPFPQTGSTPGNHAGWAPTLPGVRWVGQNNYSPVNYPGGIGHQPSPGGGAGEDFDLEALYWRLDGGNLKVLLVTSMPETRWVGGWGRYYRMGDLFIDIDGGGYDIAVATTASTGDGLHTPQPWMAYDPATQAYTPIAHSAAPGTVYALDGTDALVGVIGNQGGYGHNPNIYPQANPWVIDQALAQELAQAGLVVDTFDYGNRWGGGFYPDDPHYPGGKLRNENDTWFYEWTLSLADIDPLGYLTPQNLDGLGLHLTIECGNDVIGNTWDNIQPPGDLSPIPEASSLMALLLACGGLTGYLRSRRTA